MREGMAKMGKLYRITCMLVCTIMMGTALCAEQFILYDNDVTWNGRGKVCFSMPSGADATSNYRDWALYCRFAITEKPTDKPMRLLFCIWNSGETCGGVDASEFTEAGVYYNVHFPVSWWKKDDKPIDWTTWGPQRCILLRAHKSGTFWPWADKKTARHCYGSAITDHLPVKMHATVIAVPLDKRLALPEKFDWDDCPDDWPCGDGFPEVTASRADENGFTFFAAQPLGGGDIRISSLSPSGALRIESPRHPVQKVLVANIVGRSVVHIADGGSAVTVPAHTLAAGVNIIAVQVDGRTIVRKGVIVR